MKQVKKISLKSIIMLFVLLVGVGFLSICILNIMVVTSTQNKIVSVDEAKNKEVDCILVLGAGVSDQGVPSPMLRDRLNKGIELYEANVSDRLLMSGDHGNLDYDEVNVMKHYAIDKGILSSDIFMDHAGFSTYESLIRARDVFLVRKVLIVSQKDHLYRAIYIAKSLGMEAYGVAAEDIKYGGDEIRGVREILARVKDVFTGILKPKPTFLGDPIPLNQDGDITND